MANFERAIKTLMALEFSNTRNFLHKNKGESDYTIGGVYRFAHPAWPGWPIVMDAIEYHHGNIAEASENLYNHDTVMHLVKEFYRYAFWDKLKLDAIESQNTADEIFIFAVNAGCRTAVRKAQKLIGVKEDGFIGPDTIRALNAFDSDKFDMQFDELEIQYYDSLIESRPSFSAFKNGWHNRANTV